MSLIELAKEAYVYGFPLVYNLSEVVRHVEEGVGANKAAAYNTFSHAETLAGPEDTFVTINNDTVYSMAQLDLSAGPLAIEVPETGDRYFILQFIDAWTNNFAYIGTRSIGEKGGKFIILPPGSQKSSPDATNEIIAPTTIVSILGRWACTGEADLPAVLTLQSKTNMYLVNGGEATQHVPQPAQVANELLFWENLRVSLQAFPDSQVFQQFQAELTPLGLWEEESPYITPDPELKEVLIAGEAAGKQFLRNFLINSDIEVQNGWQLVYHSFDYNVEFFDLGTINSETWVKPSATEEEIKDVYIYRAAAALGGLWGNHGYEACYSSIYVDSQGERLDGNHKYQITLATQPPVDAFWSITMYDATDFYLVENKINRYSIGDRTEGIQLNQDGSLTLTFSHEEPMDKVERANWLPAPKGLFRPVLRMYLPQEAITTAEYVLAPLVKIN